MLWSDRRTACSRRRGISAAISAIVVGLSATMLAPAQLSTGSITGTVIDPQGAAIAGVKVLAVETSTNFQARSETNSDGLYRIQSLQPGTYDVTFELRDSRALCKKGLQLRVGDVLPVDGTLQLGQVSEQMEVTSTPRFSKPKHRPPAP